MTKVTFIKNNAVQRVLFYETLDLDKARILAERQAGQRVTLIVEAV